MLHGAGQTRYSWHRSAQSIAANGYYVLTLDTRGHGESDWSSGQDYSIDSLVDDLRAVVKQLDRGAPAVVGASLGGITALLAQGEQSTGLFSLIALVDITPTVDMQGVARILDFMSRFKTPSQLHGVMPSSQLLIGLPLSSTTPQALLRLKAQRCKLGSTGSA